MKQLLHRLVVVLGDAFLKIGNKHAPGICTWGIVVEIAVLVERPTSRNKQDRKKHAKLWCVLDWLFRRFLFQAHCGFMVFSSALAKTQSAHSDFVERQKTLQTSIIPCMRNPFVAYIAGL